MPRGKPTLRKCFHTLTELFPTPKHRQRLTRCPGRVVLCCSPRPAYSGARASKSSNCATPPNRVRMRACNRLTMAHSSSSMRSRARRCVSSEYRMRGLCEDSAEQICCTSFSSLCEQWRGWYVRGWHDGASYCHWHGDYEQHDRSIDASIAFEFWTHDNTPSS